MPVLYSLPLQKPSAITCAVHGNFSGPKAQEIVVCKAGKVLELLRPDSAGGGESVNIRTVYSAETFGLIRTMAPFRLVGAPTDYLLLGTDSGKTIILQYNKSRSREGAPSAGVFVVVHAEAFGKTGVRRVVPGQYVAVEPKGRGLMVASVERQKFVYVLNRDAAEKLTISSPLEAHKSQCLCHALVALDMGFENPIFACIEQLYDDEQDSGPKPPKILSLYELDLGINFVTRRVVGNLPHSAHALMPVPASPSGPGGVLIVCAGFLIYKKVISSSGVDAAAQRQIEELQSEAACAFPRRLEMGTAEVDLSVESQGFEMKMPAGLLVSSWAVHRVKNFFFFLLQTELGDLYKVTVQHGDGNVKAVHVAYFDSIPPSVSLCVLKTGFLFAATEAGDHFLYQFQSLGDDNEEAACSSDHPHGANAVVAFKPRLLRNLSKAASLPSLAPATHMEIFSPERPGHSGASNSPNRELAICVATGSGPRSSLCVLRPGLSINHLAAAPLESVAKAIFSVRKTYAEPADGPAGIRFVVLAYENGTIILGPEGGEMQTLKEEDTNVRGDVETLCIGVMIDDSVVQIHPQGFRHLYPGSSRQPKNWKAGSVVKCGCISQDGRTVVLGVESGSLNEDKLFVFELDRYTRDLTGREPVVVDVGASVCCVAAFNQLVAYGRQDGIVRLLVKRDATRMRDVSAQALPASSQPCSLFLGCLGVKIPGENEVPSGNVDLFIGTDTGVLIRCSVGTSDGAGKLTDARTRFLGAREIHLGQIVVGGRFALMANGKKSWLIYTDADLQMNPGQPSRLISVPLSIPSHAKCVYSSASFSSVEMCSEGVCALAAHEDPNQCELRFFSFERLNETFYSESHALSFTPRKVVALPSYETAPLVGLDPAQAKQSPSVVAVVEADHNSYDEQTQEEIREALKGIDVSVQEDEEMLGAQVKRERDEKKEKSASDGRDEKQCGSLKAGPGKWGSCVRVLDVDVGPDESLLSKVDMEVDEAALCAAVIHFSEMDGKPALVVGTAFNLSLRPRQVPKAAVRVYVWDERFKLTLKHTTPIEGQPLSLAEFDGKLLVGVTVPEGEDEGRGVGGNGRLTMYSCGKARLLRKCEYKGFPEGPVWVRAVRDRIFLGDMRESMHVLRYSPILNQLTVLCDDFVPRWITCGELVDPMTVVGGDKFENFFMSRIPSDAIAFANANAVSSYESTERLKVKGDTRYATGHCNKLEQQCSFHLGEMITGLKKAKLSEGGMDCVIALGLTGGLTAFLPLLSRAEIDLLQHLEMALRMESPSLLNLTSRDHMAYRGYHYPLQNVVDGALCERFFDLPASVQQSVAQGLDRSVADISRKLEELRQRCI